MIRALHSRVAVSLSVAMLCGAAVAVALSAAAAVPAVSESSDVLSAAPLAASAPQAAWAPLDGFESDAWPDPGLWRLPDEPQVTWWPSTCEAKTGLRGLRAFGGGRGTIEAPCEAEVPPASTSTITMRLDLRDTELAHRIDLFFDLWLMLPPGTDQGLFVHLLMPKEDGGVERIPVFGATATGGEWAFPMRMLDLLNLSNIEDPDQPIDLRGDVWHLVWTAYAPNGAPAGGGVFIDNVSLVWEPDPAVPTPTPWVTMTPSPTVTPSATPPPTSTSTRTATTEPTPILLFVPKVFKEPPPTPTPSPTATETPTPDPAATETPTPDPAATGEPTPDPAATGEPTGASTAEPLESATPGPAATDTPGTEASDTPRPPMTEPPSPAATATKTPPVVETLPPATRTPTTAPTPFE